jgi:hypothetical protein
MPSTLIGQVSSVPSAIGMTAPRFAIAYSCQPKKPDTKLPTGSNASFEATTCPTVAPRITSPSATGGM